MSKQNNSGQREKERLQTRVYKDSIEKFRAIAEELGGDQSEAFDAMLTAFECAESVPDRKPDIDRFRNYTTALLHMYTASVQQWADASVIAEDKIRTKINDQNKKVEQLETTIKELNAETERCRETEEKYKDALLNNQSLQEQIDSLKLINGNLLRQVESCEDVNTLKDRINKMETELAVLRKERDWMQQMITLLENQCNGRNGLILDTDLNH